MKERLRYFGSPKTIDVFHCRCSVEAESCRQKNDRKTRRRRPRFSLPRNPIFVSNSDRRKRATTIFGRNSTSIRRFDADHRRKVRIRTNVRIHPPQVDLSHRQYRSDVSAKLAGSVDSRGRRSHRFTSKMFPILLR